MDLAPKCEENSENLEQSNFHQTLRVRDDLILPTIEKLPLEENIAYDTNPQLETIPEPVPVRIGEFQYACPICSKMTKNLYNMKTHILTHTDVRPFACVHCGKAFKQKDHLNSHFRAHSQK